jgi:hypothetical protein
VIVSQVIREIDVKDVLLVSLVTIVTIMWECVHNPVKMEQHVWNQCIPDVGPFSTNFNVTDFGIKIFVMKLMDGAGVPSST